MSKPRYLKGKRVYSRSASHMGSRIRGSHRGEGLQAGGRTEVWCLGDDIKEDLVCTPSHIKTTGFEDGMDGWHGIPDGWLEGEDPVFDQALEIAREKLADLATPTGTREQLRAKGWPEKHVKDILTLRKICLKEAIEELHMEQDMLPWAAALRGGGVTVWEGNNANVKSWHNSRKELDA